jgi:hypothetical protein
MEDILAEICTESDEDIIKPTGIYNIIYIIHIYDIYIIYMRPWYI